MTRLILMVVAVIGFATPTADAAQKTGTLPAEAEAVIRKARDAAQNKDLKTLRSLMVQEFLWSFGGDRDADQAITEWKKDANVLSHIVRVLDKGCKYVEPRKVECPGAGDLSYRAGFTQRQTQWQMDYFVAGD